MGGGRQLGFTKMFPNNFRMPWAFAEIWTTYTLGVTEIGKFYQNMRNFENPRWRRPPSWIYKNVNQLPHGLSFLLKFELHIPWRNRKLENFIRSAKFWKIQDGGRPPSWIYKNVNNFRMDWAFWLKFELHIPWRNRNWKISSEMRNFENPRWRPAAILDLPKC